MEIKKEWLYHNDISCDCDICSNQKKAIKKYKQEVNKAILKFNGTPNVWLKSEVSDKAFAKLVKELDIKNDK